MSTSIVILKPCSPSEVILKDSAGTTISTTSINSGVNTTITAPDGTVHIKKENDGTLSNVTVVSNGSTDYIIQNNDITVNLANPFSIHAEDPLDIRLHNVNGTDITPTSVTYQGNQNHVTAVIGNSTAILKDSAGITISTTGINPTASANITAPDGAITVNGSSVGSVKSNDTRALLVKLNGSQAGTYDGINTINITTTPKGAEQLKTFQTTSYATGDDGNIQTGRGNTHLVLGWDNAFGNTNRFTDEFGGQTYTSGIVLDHYQDNGTSIQGYYKNVGGNSSWATNITYCNGLTVGSFSGWRMVNVRQLEVLLNYEILQPMNFAPFNFNGYVFHSSTSFKQDTATYCHGLSGQYMFIIGKGAASGRALACRRFTYAELGL